MGRFIELDGIDYQAGTFPPDHPGCVYGDESVGYLSCLVEAGHIGGQGIQEGRIDLLEQGEDFVSDKVALINRVGIAAVLPPG